MSSEYSNQPERVQKIKLTKKFVSKHIPTREKQSYKGDYGKILCIGGSVKMAGAITLSAKAALYSGAGLVTVATHPENFSVVHSACLEIMCTDYTDFDELKSHIEQSDTILIGPGLGRSRFSKDLFEMILQSVSDEQNFIIDADGLYFLSQMNYNDVSLPAKTILTPHLGEWERLTGITPSKQTESKNKSCQHKLGATIVLKSHQTIVYSDEFIYQNTVGNPGMAVGGMGDTLAGMIAGLVKQCEFPITGVASAVYLHSYIGDLLYKDQYVALPSQIIEQIPTIMNQF